MTARWTALGLWAAVAACGVYWGLKLFVPAAPVPAHAVVARLAGPPRGDLSRLLGVDTAPAEAAPPAASTRFHLIGVVAARPGDAAREGLALIAVDDKPPRTYRVGALVDGNTVLQAVHARGVALGPRDGAADFSLDIPPPAPPATGALPGVAGLSGQSPAPPVAPQLPFARGTARPMPAPGLRLQQPLPQQPPPADSQPDANPAGNGQPTQ